MSPPPGAPGVLQTQWILFKVAARRYSNRFFSTFHRRKKKAATQQTREATTRKGKKSALLPLAMGLLFVFSATNTVSNWIGRVAPAFGARSPDGLLYVVSGDTPALFDLHGRLDDLSNREAPASDASVRPAADQTRRLLRADAEAHFRKTLVELAVPDSRLDVATQRYTDAFMKDGYEAFDSVAPAGLMSVHDWSAPESSRLLRNALAWILCCSSLALLLLGLGSGNKDLAKVDWSFEWLYSFPVSARALFLSRFLEQTLLNVFGWIVHFGLFLAVFLSLGYGGLAFALALAGALCGNLLIATARVSIETLLRRRASLSAIKNIQALCTVLGSLSLLALYGLVFRRPPAFFMELVYQSPGALAWMPHTALAGIVGDVGSVTLRLVFLFLSSAVVAWMALGICELSVRRGLMASGGVAQGKRGPGPAAGPGMLRGIVGKEVRLLLRDRNFMVQTLFVPIFVFALQLVLYPGILSELSEDPSRAIAIAFAVGAYVLLNTGPTVFSSEKDSLWLLFSLPHAVDRILRRKAYLWAGVALLYCAGILLWLWSQGPPATTQALCATLMALVGMPIFSLLSSGLAVIGADPLETKHKQKLSPTLVYLFLLLAAMYAYGLYQAPWSQLTIVILFALLAIAVWQTVSDRVPYLLDPTQLPPPRTSLSDGLVAALLFFVLQAFVGGISHGHLPLGPGLLLSFALAGALVFAIFLFTLWRRHVPQLLEALGFRARPDHAASVWQAIAWGLAAGAVAGGGALGYGALSDLIEPLRLLREASLVSSRDIDGDLYRWLLILAIVAAPLFEEFIFRALVFRGMRRSTGFGMAAVASAAIFAIVHPPYAMLPVFGLGLATALSFEKGGRLLAPMLSHAVYNAMVLLLM